MSVPEDIESLQVLSFVRPAVARPIDPQSEALSRDYGGLYALILRRVGDPQVAGDILQDAIVTTLHKLRSGQIDRPDCAGGYIYRVALNHLRNYRRKDRSRISSSENLEQVEDASAAAAVEAMDRTYWSQVVALLLTELPTARDREVLVRFYLNEEEKESICRSLGLTEAHFHRVICRARGRFRELIERKGYRKRDLLAVAVLTLCTVMLAAHGPRASTLDLVAPATTAACGPPTIEDGP